MAVIQKNKTKSEPPATVQNFPIVGIGASAGGLEAFKCLIKEIPENSGMAYVLVQHLDPAHESILPEILQRVTKIPVLEITDDIHLAPDHIYVIPPNKMLISVDGVLKLTERAKKINLSIDVFFTSLAEVHKEFAIGVVLSGTGTDGTSGLKTIKEHGGISIAQDAESATYDGMPQNAINAGVVDFILPPEKILGQLLLINSTFQTTHVFKEEEQLPKNDEAIFKQIISIIRIRTGVDFTYYKQPTFHRRIARRITITQKIDLSDYLKFFRTDKAEQDALFQDILIPVTSFFRDPKTFLFLSNTIFPALFKNKLKEDPFRIWIAGCSTGEEVYSIAICINEYITLTKREGLKVQLFATDISEKAIKKARSGIYNKSEVEKLSPDRIKNYFIKKNGSYEVNKLIRDMCIFTQHNFLKDPPFEKMDLISCRNVLIYMDSFHQKKALTTFHYALKENGFLILGRSESTNCVSELFSSADKHEKVYSRKQISGRNIPIATERKEEALVIKNQKIIKLEPTQTDFRKSAEAMLLSKFTPASVVVNEQMDIVHIHGIITPYLVAPQGKSTFNLLKMANEGLAFELRNALHKSKLKDSTIIKENIPIKMNGIQFLVNIEIVPLADTLDIHYLILFTKTAIPVLTDKTKSTSSRKIAEALSKNEQLEKDLAITREELQSNNEELTIVNQELLDKQEQLNIARLYSDSIVTTIRHPLIVLDKLLRIKTANASFYKKFNIDEHDIEGKLFYEIQNSLWDDTLMRTMLERILPQHERLSDFKITLNFPSLGERHLLLNALQIVNDKNSEQLILLAIEDITEQVSTQKIIDANKNIVEKERKLLHNFFTHAPAIFAILKGPDYVFEFANPAYIELIGGRNPTGLPMLEAVPEIKGQGFIELLDNVYNTGQTFVGKEVPVIIDKGTGKHEQFYLNFKYQALKNDKGETEGILIFAYDVSELVMGRKQVEANALMVHNIYMNAPAAICTFKGSKHIYELVNPAYQKLFDKRNLMGKPVLEALPELKGQGVDEILDKVYTTGEIFRSTEIPVMIAKADNLELEQRYYNTTMQPIYDAAQKIIGVVNFGYDVTDQIMARKQIEASELYNRNILDSSPDCLKILDIEGRIQYINFNGICQMEIEDFTKVKSQYWWDFWGNENQDLLKAAVDKALAGETAQFSAFCATAKGTPKWWDVLVSPITKTGEGVQQIVAVSRDVTERKIAEKLLQESEAKFRALCETIPNMIWTATADGKKNFFNKYFLNYTGLTVEDLQGDGMHKIIFPEDLEKDLQLWNHSLKTGEDFNMEKRFRRHDGTYRWHSSHGIAQKDEQGKITGWIGSSTDIDELKILAKELMEAKVVAERTTLIAEDEKTKAEAAMQSKQQFLSNMSHEIRTPMNAIIGFTKVLMKTDLDEKQQDFLQAIKSSGNTLIVLINDILDLAKVDAGKMIFANLPFKLSESIITILHLFETKIQENDLELVKEYDSRIPEIVLGDSVRLHQILINLLGNAIKFTEKGKIIVSVNLLNEDEEKATIEIKVTDTGIGIPANKIQNIFNDFEQAYMDTSRVYGGTGLGLSIVKQLVEKQGGSVSVISTVDVGSTFSFALSFQKTNAVINVEVEEDSNESVLKSIKILVVEDVKLNQLLLCTILDDYKFTCDLADNGKIAIEKLQNNTYDIILMDLQMPIMNGFEATEYIRNTMNILTPIIALTADVTTVDLDKCKAIGMNDYISKPLDDKLLYNKIIDLIKST